MNQYPSGPKKAYPRVNKNWLYELAMTPDGETASGKVVRFSKEQIRNLEANRKGKP